MTKVVATAAATAAAAAAVLAFANVDAQTDPKVEQLSSVAEHLQSSFVTRRGAEDPASIPRGMAVANLRHSISELGLEQGDIAVLERWAQEAVELEQQGKERSESHYHEFCNRLQSGVADVVSELNEASRLVTERHNAVLSSFEAAATLLSDRGRAVVNSYIDNVLIPSTAFVELDHEMLLRETRPEAVAAQFHGTCVLRATHSEEEIREMVKRARDASAGPDSSRERGGHSDSDNNAQQQGAGAELRSM